MLVGTEKPEDFREVTDAEKAAIEAADAKWTSPPRSFIDFWNQACEVRHAHGILKNYKNGGYNETTGFFERNGLTDITYEQARRIADQYIRGMSLWNCRTNLPLFRDRGKLNLMLTNAYGLEVFWGVPEFYPVLDAAQNCPVREYRYIEIERFVNYQFQSNLRLETIRDIKITARGTMVIDSSPLLTRESVAVLVDANPEGNTIRVHPDVFAKLTDEANAEWHQVLLDAEAKNITFATA